jgi:hypothetical protein
MKLVVALATLGLGLVGCKGSSTTPCAASINGVLDRAVASSDEREPVVSEMEHRLGDALVKLCTEDRWSAPMLACIDAAGDSESAKACTSKLSSSQLARLNKLLSELTGLPIGATPHTSSPQTSSGNQTTGEAR